MLRDVPWYKEITRELLEDDLPEETNSVPSAPAQNYLKAAESFSGGEPSVHPLATEDILERVLSEAVRQKRAPAVASHQARASKDNRKVLAKYLTDEILPGEIQVKDLLNVMDLIDNVTDTGAAESAMRSQIEIPEQMRYYEKASKELQKLYDKLNRYVAEDLLKYGSAEDLKRVSDLSTVIPVRPVTGTRVPRGETVFTSLIRARNNQLKLYVNIDPAPEVEKLEEALDATSFGKHGTGNLEVTLTPDKFFGDKRQQEIVYGWLRKSVDEASQAAQARDSLTA